MTFKTITTEVNVDNVMDLPKELLLLNSRKDIKDLFIRILEENYDPSDWSRQVTTQKLDSILS